MRLTLRSMLAYIDEVDELDPADHEEIGRKIEESEFATNLLHRIRDVSRRMRLDATKPLGRGLGLDPNTVAEYIDNTLGGDRVPEFEKICLESDRHLAELASCHQILTLVLREPAEVDPGLRRRMYEIGAGGEPPKQGLEAESVGAAAVASAAPPEEPRAVPVRAKPEVPEYLRRGSRSRFWPITITIALALGLAFVVVSALGPLDGTNPALKWLLGGKKNDVAQNNQNPAAQPKVTPPAPIDERKAPDKEGNPPAAPSDLHPAQNGQSPPDKTATPTGTTPSTTDEPTVPATPGVAPEVNAKLTQPQSVPPAAPQPDERTAPAAPLPPALEAKGNELKPADKSAATVPQVPGVALSGDAGPAVPPAPVPAGSPAANPATPAPPAPGTTDTNAVPPGSPAAATAGRPLGRFPSDQQDVLLQMDAAHGQWQRMAPGSTLREGDKLLALPTFRSKISFGNGVSLMLYPETLIDLLGVDAQGVVAIRVEYGRLKVETPGKGDMRLRLSLGRAGGTLVFADPEAAAAAEVHPYNYPGVDPEANPPHIGVALYATGGQVEWIPDGAGDLPNAAGNRLKAPAALILAPFAAPSIGPERELPKWLATGVEPLSLLEARASQALNQALDGKETVTVALRELAGHRRTENRSLAARSLYLLDEFDALVDLLNDPDQKSIWDLQIDSVQAALDRSPNTAAKIRSTFERQVGKDGGDLYRMLWGYDKDQLQAGAAATLVDMLDVDSTAFSLAFRVVSFHDLRTITGATFNYRPEASAAGRGTAVRRWREQLKDGLIVPRGTPPAKPVAESPAGTLPPVAPPKAPPPPQPEE